VLLVFGAPCQHETLAGQEHGRTIPLADSRREPQRLSRVPSNDLHNKIIRGMISCAYYSVLFSESF
jgi:hypothetical protein